jgi:hypothetical protein
VSLELTPAKDDELHPSYLGLTRSSFTYSGQTETAVNSPSTAVGPSRSAARGGTRPPLSLTNLAIPSGRLCGKSLDWPGQDADPHDASWGPRSKTYWPNGILHAHMEPESRAEQVKRQPTAGSMIERERERESTKAVMSGR